MRYFISFIVVAVLCFAGLSCNRGGQEMTIEDYAKIETELNIPDPELDPQLVEKVSSKYGYTYEQYKSFFKKVQGDPILREKLGGIRLKESSK